MHDSNDSNHRNLREPYECLHMPNRAYTTLTTQLKAVIIAVSTVQVLRLRTMNGTYSPTEFHNGQASYFNMKVLVFAEPGHKQFF